MMHGELHRYCKVAFVFPQFSITDFFINVRKPLVLLTHLNWGNRNKADSKKAESQKSGIRRTLTE